MMEDDEGCNKNGGKIACFSKDNFGLFNALFGFECLL